MVNVNYLPNKCDELEVLVQNQRLYRESTFICLSGQYTGLSIETRGRAEGGKVGALSYFLIGDVLSPGCLGEGMLSRH